MGHTASGNAARSVTNPEEPHDPRTTYLFFLPFYIETTWYVIHMMCSFVVLTPCYRASRIMSRTLLFCAYLVCSTTVELVFRHFWACKERHCFSCSVVLAFHVALQRLQTWRNCRHSSRAAHDASIISTCVTDCLLQILFHYCIQQCCVEHLVGLSLARSVVPHHHTIRRHRVQWN